MNGSTQTDVAADPLLVFDAVDALLTDPGGEARRLLSRQVVGDALNLTNASGKIHLAWEAPPDDGGGAILRYVVEQDLGEGFVPIAQTTARQLAYTDTPAQLAKTVKYRVRAANVAGEGEAGAEVCMKPFPWATPPVVGPQCGLPFT